MRHDLLSDVMSIINNAEKVGKRACIVPASKLIRDLLKVIQNEGYVGEFEFIDDGKSGKFSVGLLGKINKASVIKPRFSSKADAFEKWEKRYLPSRNIGLLIVSTPRGVMSHADAKKNKTGGKLLAYIY